MYIFWVFCALLHQNLSLSYRACYRIDYNDRDVANCFECKRRIKGRQVIKLDTEEGEDHISMGINEYTLYEIKTPVAGSGYYPNNRICTYSLIPRKYNHVFSYVFDDFEFDFEKGGSKGTCYDSMVKSYL